MLPLPLQSRQRKAGLQQTPSIILGTACVWFCRYWFHFVISSETRMENERKMGGEEKKNTTMSMMLISPVIAEVSQVLCGDSRMK